MKKTLRVITAVVLALVIAMGSMSAFASGETVVFDYADSEYEYFYGGKLTEGKNTVDFSGDEIYLYYEFEAEKDGYYIVETNPEQVWWIALAEESASGKYHENDILDYTNLDYSETEKNLFYFEKGAYCLFADKNEEFNGKAEFSIEYAGAEITSVDFESGIKYSLIQDLDIYSEYIDYEEKYYGAFSSGAASITFDSGKNYDVDLGYLFFTSESEITKGKNTITIDFAGKTFEKTILVESIRDHIKSVEVKNFDEFDTAEVYYDGCLNDYDVDLSGLELVVEFADGKKETVAVDYYYASVELPNGNPVPIDLYCGYDTDDDGNLIFSVWAGETVFVVLPVEAVEVSMFENMKHLSDENTNVITEEAYEIFWDYINILSSGSTEEVFAEIKNLFVHFFTFIPDVMKGMFNNFAILIGI